MATKSNNVFVKLTAIGADAAARDIDKVRKSLDDLSKARKTSAEVDKEAAAQQRDLVKSTRAMNTAMTRQNKIMDGLRQSQRMFIQNGKILSENADRQTSRAIKNQHRIQKINRLIAKGEKDKTRATKNTANAEQALWNKRNTIHKAYLGYLRDERVAVERAERVKRTELEKTMRLEEKQNREYARAQQQFARQRKQALSNLAPKGLPTFRRPFRVAMIASITTLVADALGFVATGINALGAGAIAGVNGLAPLTGMLITIPALFTTLAQSIAPATWGISNFVKAWKGDKDSLKDAGKNTLALSKAIKKLKPEFDKMQKSVGERFIQGFDKSFGKLANVYLPILKKRLNGTAAAFNSVLGAGMRWLSSARGQSVVDTIMGTNNAIIRGGGGGVLNLLKGVGGLMKAASPMLRTAAADFKTWSGDLQKKIFANQKGLGGFFDKSYRTFKGVTGTLGNFGSGLYHLFKQAQPLTDHMGGAIKQAGIDFMNWTKGDGIAEIQKFFKEMQPNLDSVVGLAGDLATTLFDIGRSPNFKKTVDEIRTGLLPAIKRIAKAADGKFIPNLVKFAEAMAKFGESGAIDALSELGGTIVGWIDRAATFFSELDYGTQKAIIYAVALSGLFGGIASIIGGMVINMAKLIALMASGAKMGFGVFGRGRGAGGGGGAFVGGGGGKGKGGGGGSRGGVIAGGGGKGSKPGKKTGSGGVIAGGGGGKKGGSKKGKPTGSGGTLANGGNNKNKPSTPKPTRKGVAGAGAGAVGGALAFLAVGPATDQLSGVSAAMSDVEYKANGLMTTGRSLDGMFADVSQGNMQTFNGALTQVANPSKYMKFEQGVAAVGGAILGATPPLDVAKAKFEGIDAALTNMPADQAATQFGKIRAQAVQLGIPMDKLTAQFPQYRDSVASTVTANDKLAGGMGNSTVAANKMAGVVGGPVKRSLMDVDSMQVKPKKFDATDNVTPKATAAGSGVRTLDGLTANPTMKATDGVTPKVSTAKGALGGLNGSTANTAIKTTNEAPGAASAAAGALAGIDGRTATTYIKTVRSVSEVRLGGASGGRGSGPGRWTGGMTNPGTNYTVGERGPEIGITRSGSMMLLGAGGQHQFSPDSATAIIPAGATRDPLNGNYGQAPDWAKKMLQGGAAQNAATAMGSGRGNGVFAPNVKVTVNNPAQTVDVKRAVRDAIIEIEYDREGRR